MSSVAHATLIRTNFDRYAYGRDNGHLAFVKKANACDDYFAGLQWDPILKKRLERQVRQVRKGIEELGAGNWLRHAQHARTGLQTRTTARR